MCILLPAADLWQSLKSAPAKQRTVRVPVGRLEHPGGPAEARRMSREAGQGGGGWNKVRKGTTKVVTGLVGWNRVVMDRERMDWVWEGIKLGCC